MATLRLKKPVMWNWYMPCVEHELPELLADALVLGSSLCKGLVRHVFLFKKVVSKCKHVNFGIHSDSFPEFRTVYFNTY